MLIVTLPDGTKKEAQENSTVLDIAQSIGKRLAEDAVAAYVGDQLVDLNFQLKNNSDVKIVTINTEDGIEIIRHDAAHILAQAVKELYPNTKLGVGPTIENGFYYDIKFEHDISNSDLEKIEQKMHEIASKNYPINRYEWTKEEAISFFKESGEKYKLELIEKFPEDEVISIYKQGEFVDLCRGPHSPSTGKVRHFKLLKISGAYWLGDQKNDSLQRIYGTAWATKKELTDHLNLLEEAKKRDHRKIGQSMNLFHMQEEAQGQVFWHERGWQLYRILEQYIRDKLSKHDYTEVKTPLLFDRILWEKSGHWEKFKENMFTLKDEQKDLALKPMNCPAHIEIFKQGVKSYKDLPLRLAEFGMCHRNESHGALHGLMRVRQFVQDDAHIFCTEGQIKEETKKFCDLLLEVYNELGFSNVEIKFSDRPELRIGDDAVWDKAEEALKNAVKEAGLSYTLNSGEGAFYGPKIEFTLTDAIGRQWQCGTLQVDFMLPERLGATYIDAEGQKKHPVMLHRAVLGTFERFIGILIEHYEGKFPLWLAPVQVCIANITEHAKEYANEICNLLKIEKVRAIVDTENKNLDYKIRLHSLNKIPIMWIVGQNELKSRSVSIRNFGGKNTVVKSLDDAILDIKQRGLN